METAHAAKLVEGALSQWLGLALADFRYEDFAQSDAFRLDGSRLGAEELKIDIALSAGGRARANPPLSQ
jgi:hypothetical protein